MKNFKKVISAVIALALSASTLVAVSASTFSDVDNTSYADAIDKLAALDIVHGYAEKDGYVFKPDGDITRAEAATMIVGALNMTEDAKAAAGTSKFTDVNEQASWATGYVNVGVAQDFIHGMDETTFAPQQNVTYAQMCVMLTFITGYGEYAKNYGEYPTGYTTMAASAGINKGVSVTADTPLKRGQVAQMLYNALTTNMLGVKSFKAGGENEYAVCDGADLAFKTVLSSKFNGYEVDVKITDTSKGNLENGKVKVALTKKAYLDEVKGESAKEDKDYDFDGEIYDDFGVAEYKDFEGKAIVFKDNKDWHLVYFEASGSNIDTVDAAKYESKADGGKSVDDKKITFGSKSYDVNLAGKIYVNGQEYGDMTEDNASKVLKAAQGEVKLVDTDKDTKGYEKIMATVYDIAEVSDVNYANEATTITFTNKTGFTKATSLKVTDDGIKDSKVAVTVKDAKGKDIALKDIKADDIIAFAVTEWDKTKLEDPKSVEILTTNEKISGTVEKKDNTEETVTIGEKAYELVVWGDPNPAINTTYSFTLDPFGRIYGQTVESSSAKLAIIEKYDDSDDGKLTLVLPDGSSQTYEFESDAAITLDGNNITKGEIKAYIDTNKKNPAKRVVNYTVKNSTGKLQKIVSATSVANGELTYKARTGKLGSIEIIDSTAALNVQDYIEGNNQEISKYQTFAVKNFSNDAKYTATVYGTEGDSKKAALVILTKVGDTITAESRFAVVRKGYADDKTEDGDACYSVNVLYEGEEQDLLFGLNSKAEELNPGDAFFFTTDSEGLVNDYAVIFKFNKSYANAYGTFSFDASAGKITSKGGKNFTFDKEKWTTDIKSKNDYKLVYGIVTDVTKNGVEFAIEDPADTIDLNNTEKVETFGIDSDWETYRFGVDEQIEKNYYKAITVSAPTKSSIGSYETEKNSAKYNLKKYDDQDGHKDLTYALALVVDDNIVEIYSILQ